jgi:quercetin dioxygenase-like cupin family protein
MSKRACAVASILCLAAAVAAQGVPGSLIDNDRVVVWDVTAGDPHAPRPQDDAVWVSVAAPGKVAWVPAGRRGDAAGLGGRAIVIDVKKSRPARVANTSGYPLAFPRPGALKKLLENDRVIVWDYTWAPNTPTPMHFHDKDVVVLYVADGALKSTTPDGQSTTNDFTAGTVRFNRANRVHTEVLTQGSARAIITELK